MARNRNLKFAVAFLVLYGALAFSLVSADSLRCSLYRNLGYIHLRKGTVAQSPPELSVARRWFSAALLRGCPAAPATFGLAHTYSSLGQPSSALSALTAGQDRAELRRLMKGSVYDELGSTEAARREYWKLPRDAAARFYGLGLRSQLEGDFDSALHYYAVARMINPGSTKSYYGAASVHWQRSGEDDEARELIQQALAIEPATEAESFLTPARPQRGFKLGAE